MRRALGLFAALILAAFASEAVLSSQSVVYRNRIAKRGGDSPVVLLPLISILSPTTSPSITVDTNIVQLMGTCGPASCTSITWTCATCTTTTGFAVGASDWTIAPGSGTNGQSVVSDAFTEASNTALDDHVPSAAGLAWTELANTSSTSLQVYGASGVLGPVASDVTTNKTILALVTPNSALAGPEYDVSWQVGSGFSNTANQGVGVIFSVQDASNYCGIAVGHSGDALDVFLFKRVANTVTTIASANGASQTVGYTYRLEVRGTSIKVITTSPVGVVNERINTTDPFCDNDTEVGVFYGSARQASDIITTSSKLDNFTVVDQGAATNGLTLASGPNPIEVCGSDGVNSRCSTITVTYAPAGDTVDPFVAIDTPTASATYSTSTESLTIGGPVTDNVDATPTVTWTCATCTPTSGTADVASGRWSDDIASQASGANTIVVTATDDDKNDASDTLVSTYTPNDVTAPTVAFSSPANNATFTTTPVTFLVSGTASDGVGVDRVDFDCGAAGSGLALGSSSWTFTLSNVVNGTYVCSVTARDAAGNVSTAATRTFIAAVPVVAGTASLPQARVGTAYNFCLTASGGTQPYTWSKVSGTYPAGLSLVSGCIVGTPNAATDGAYTNHVYRVTDDDSLTDDTIAMVLTVVEDTDEGPNDFFDELRALPTCLNALSLRPNPAATSPASATCASPHFAYQFNSRYVSTQRGYSAGVDDWGYPGFRQLTYDYAGDTHPEKADGVKVRIPAFYRVGVLAAGISDSALLMTMNSMHGAIAFGSYLLLDDGDNVPEENGDDEVVRVTNTGPSASNIQIARGISVTEPKAWLAGTRVWMSKNDISDQLYYPISMSQDGHFYYATIDMWLTSTYQNVNTSYKWLQLADDGGTSPSTFWEFNPARVGDSSPYFPGTTTPGTTFTPDTLFYPQIRSYNGCSNPGTNCGPSLPGHIEKNPLAPGNPLTGELSPVFSMKQGRWIRIHMTYYQVAGQNDYASLWVSDETTPAMRIYTEARPNAQGNPPGIAVFWFEMNTSHQRGQVRAQGTPYESLLAELVSYYRNFVWMDMGTDATAAMNTVINDYVTRLPKR